MVTRIAAPGYRPSSQPGHLKTLPTGNFNFEKNTICRLHRCGARGSERSANLPKVTEQLTESWDSRRQWAPGPPAEAVPRAPRRAASRSPRRPPAPHKVGVGAGGWHPSAQQGGRGGRGRSHQPADWGTQVRPHTAEGCGPQGRRLRRRSGGWQGRGLGAPREARAARSGGADRGRPAGAPSSRAARLRSRSPTCRLRGPGARGRHRRVCRLLRALLRALLRVHARSCGCRRLRRELRGRTRGRARRMFGRGRRAAGRRTKPPFFPPPPPRPSPGPPPPPGRGRGGLGKVTRPAASSASAPGGGRESKDVRSRTSFWGGEAGHGEQGGRAGSRGGERALAELEGRLQQEGWKLDSRRDFPRRKGRGGGPQTWAVRERMTGA